ncbi:TadE/TadG family type IV pilus assembly protein [Variovorax sp. EBFNA2]|uniref:TadE/TadG family type IV pilus assembly protein n=1 Tax=Variovorax sp. EBFNA2 TaxID=3342097 RepID=UPI0029C0F305|nr:TadE/TadG family type IV pilus assembly protein [Variovorax boronicumulans]WPG36899.1 TadE/TadG family type IV pilus assembly protein [Variovorax boronicumulans]
MQAIRAPGSPRSQRGVYAIEFAMVFLIFFTVLYAAICYGMLFAFRLGLQNAAEDGARAALQYQSTLGARVARATSVAEARSDWMPRVKRPDVSICHVEGAAGVDLCPASACGPSWSQRCQVQVVVQAGDLQSVLPPLPSFAVPDQIAGRASMLLELR